MDKNKLEKVITKASELQKGKEIALAKEFISIEDKLNTLSEDLKKKLESELVLEINKEELKGDPGSPGKDGEDGKDYILTPQDKQEIASSIKVPIVEKVVEKIIEKTEVVRETPIVTENVVEVAKYETPDEITNKVNLGKPLIKKERIEGFADLDRIVKENAHKLYTGISETRALELIRNNTSTSSGGGTWGSITGTLSNQTDLQTALDALVPYTGATSDVNLGTHSLTAHSIIGDATDGIILEANNGTDIGILGAANTANVTWYGNHNFNTVTASRVAQFGASKTLESSTVTNTELGYLSGVTSAIQTQINGKANTALSNLASVAINTSLLSDTTKTDDLGSATYKWKDTWTQNVYADSIGYNSLRAVFGERQIFINELTDALWRANRRYTVTQTGSGTIASLFDAGFETTYVVPVSTTDVVNINLANQSGVPANGVTYPEGKIYVHFYYTNNLYSSIQLRTKHNGVWFTASAPTDISIATGDKVLEFSVPSNNYMTDIELTVTTDGTNPVWITGINYIPLRWTSELESPFFDKVLSDNTLVGNTITFKNTANSTTASINANDNWYMGVGGSGGKFGIGTSSLTYSLHVNGHSLTESTNYHYFYDSTYGIRASTGLEFKSGDVFRWLKGSTEEMRIDTSGRLLIGTATSGDSLLEVEADLATASAVLTRLSGGSNNFSGSNDAGTGYSLVFDGCAYDTGPGIIQVDGAKISFLKENTWNYASSAIGTLGALAFYTSAGTPSAPTLTEQMRIASSGNVGIKTSSPLAGLHINRGYTDTLNQSLRLSASITGIAFEDTSSSGSHRNFALMNNYGANGLFQLTYSSSGGGNPTNILMTADGVNGRIGIGTVGPSKMVEINDASGNCLRLTYNDGDGSATNYADFAVSSGGNLTVTPSGGAFIFGGTARLKSYTVATLPTGTAGDMAYITDGDAALAWGATAVNSGAGATKYAVWFNGSVWSVFGK